MAEFVKLSAENLKALHEQNPALMSYNIEFAEVTGGTFWKAYTPGQIAGTEPFNVDMSGGLTAAYKDLMQVYDPIDLYDEKLRSLAKEFGPLWVRVSGTWSTKTYYDLDDAMEGKVPEGYLNTLTRKQWVGVLDFVKAVGAKLLISVSACPGVYGTNQAPIPAWTPREAEKIFKFSSDYGVPISASEFVNEPNMLAETGFPQGYTADDHVRDQKIFQEWLNANYPDCLYVGPCTVGGDATLGKKAGGVENLVMQTCKSADLMGDVGTKLDVFSYHYYNGVSERLGGVMPQAHWLPEEATSEDYLAVAIDNAKIYAPLRDTYCPGGEMWVTESGDAGGGGDTWASTYLDVIRTLNEAGGFSQVTPGIIFHNTLAASDYAYLDRFTHEPRPNYFAVLLWTRLMGNTVYETEPVRMGAHVYAQSRKDGKDGVCYVVINNSETECTTVSLPKEAEIYVLAGKDGNKRATVMTLNGRDLVLGEGNTLPDLSGEKVAAGELTLAPLSCAYIVM